MRIVLSQKGAVTNMGKLHRSFVKLKSPKGDGFRPQRKF